jgi:5-methyltetrahydropteroyltriglutamate--homocysteine methyltransferase
MPHALPLLPTTVVGSYALPSWVYAADDWIARDLYGPIDIEETFNDAVDRAILDQTLAGVDVISDGEMRRRGFVQGFVRRIKGLRTAGPPRKVGEVGIDLEPVYETTGKVEVPHGLGIVEEFEYLRTHTDKPTKVAVPGPYALTAWYRPVEYYRDRTHLAEDFVPAINAEIRRLVAAGCTYIQVDEPAIPGYGRDEHTVKDLVRLFNQCVEGVPDGVRIAMHICFGTYKKIPYAKRTYAPFFPDLLEARCQQFVFEYANREMAEIDRWREWVSDGRELCAGVIDVRTHYLETVEDVAERVRTVLRYVPAEKVWLSPDCGMRRVVRYLAFGKLKALVGGARIVRQELTGRG